MEQEKINQIFIDNFTEILSILRLSSERLDRIESRLDSLEDSVLENTRKIDRNYKLIKENKQSINSLCKVAEGLLTDKVA